MGGLFKKDVFGRPYILKKFLVRIFGSFFYPRFTKKYNCISKGAENIANLPGTNVLFISNHQTYFADVALMYQIIQNAKLGHYNNVKKKGFWKMPIKNFFYVAAEETMKDGLIPKLMALTGAVTIKRTWREKGKKINREVDKSDTSNIAKALDNGWVISFPQGTTKPYSVIRKGTAHIIKDYKPIVVPIVIDGLRRAFDKKGLAKKKVNTDLRILIKEPLKIDYESSIEELVELIGESIHQNEYYKNNPKVILS